MRHIETLTGRGRVTTKAGDSNNVTYELHVLQNDVLVRSKTGPASSKPGSMEIEGHVEPVCFFGERELTLTLSDGRQLAFFFTDSFTGSIAVNGGFSRAVEKKAKRPAE